MRLPGRRVTLRVGLGVVAAFSMLMVGIGGGNPYFGRISDFIREWCETIAGEVPVSDAIINTLATVFGLGSLIVSALTQPSIEAIGTIPERMLGALRRGDVDVFFAERRAFLQAEQYYRYVKGTRPLFVTFIVCTSVWWFTKAGNSVAQHSADPKAVWWNSLWLIAGVFTLGSFADFILTSLTPPQMKGERGLDLTSVRGLMDAFPGHRHQLSAWLLEQIQPKLRVMSRYPGEWCVSVGASSEWSLEQEFEVCTLYWDAMSPNQPECQCVSKNERGWHAIPEPRSYDVLSVGLRLRGELQPLWATACLDPSAQEASFVCLETLDGPLRSEWQKAVGREAGARNVSA